MRKARIPLFRANAPGVGKIDETTIGDSVSKPVRRVLDGGKNEERRL